MPHRIHGDAPPAHLGEETRDTGRTGEITQLSHTKSAFEVSIVSIGLFDNDQVIAFHNRSALLDADLLDYTGTVGVDIVLHLHGFEHDERLARGHLVADLPP